VTTTTVVFPPTTTLAFLRDKHGVRAARLRGSRRRLPYHSSPGLRLPTYLRIYLPTYLPAHTYLPAYLPAYLTTCPTYILTY